MFGLLMMCSKRIDIVCTGPSLFQINWIHLKLLQLQEGISFLFNSFVMQVWLYIYSSCHVFLCVHSSPLTPFFLPRITYYQHLYVYGHLTNNLPSIIKGSWSGSLRSQSILEKAIAAQRNSEDWEIDWRLLKIGEKIASGSCGDLLVQCSTHSNLLTD